jgi:hypothetical protein
MLPIPLHFKSKFAKMCKTKPLVAQRLGYLHLYFRLHPMGYVLFTMITNLRTTVLCFSWRHCIKYLGRSNIQVIIRIMLNLLRFLLVTGSCGFCTMDLLSTISPEELQRSILNVPQLINHLSLNT